MKLCSYKGCREGKELPSYYCKAHRNEMRLKLYREKRRELLESGDARDIELVKYWQIGKDCRPTKEYSTNSITNELQDMIEHAEKRCAAIMLELKKGYNKELREEWQRLNNRRILAKKKLQVMKETGKLLGEEETPYFEL